jgi:hypothetical protein
MDDGAHSAEEYRKRAAAARAEATKMRDHELKETLLDVAASYERLASRVEAIARSRR